MLATSVVPIYLYWGMVPNLVLNFAIIDIGSRREGRLGYLKKPVVKIIIAVDIYCQYCNKVLNQL